jgi:two-component system, OmpR family, sensor histidine kinase BaeS
MNVRGKLFGAMALLVLLVTAAYFGTTQGYLDSRFSRYTAEDMAHQLQKYYEEHGNSWVGLERSDISDAAERHRSDYGGVPLLSPEEQILFFRGQAEPNSVIQHGFHQSIIVNGTKIGTVYTDQWESTEALQMKDYILNSMIIEGFRIGILTAVVALLLGLWLTWRLTLPLKRLIPTIEQIAHGDLHIQIPITSKDEYGKVTEALNHMAQQLQRAEEIRKQLTADVAHELRTPLAIIQVQMENIQDSGRDVPPETLLPIQDEVIRLSKLVDDLHQLTLAESGKLLLDRKPTDLVPILDRIADMLKPEADERQISISRSCPTQKMIASIDPNRITQVFYNLLINALRYTPSEGTITIHMTHTDHKGSRFATVSIKDNGVGILTEKLPYLFDRFYRVEESRSRHTGGLGLGLSIAKEYVEANQGFILVNSEVGKGSTFTVYLPQ